MLGELTFIEKLDYLSLFKVNDIWEKKEDLLNLGIEIVRLGHYVGEDYKEGIFDLKNNFATLEFLPNEYNTQLIKKIWPSKNKKEILIWVQDE